MSKSELFTVALGAAAVGAIAAFLLEGTPAPVRGPDGHWCVAGSDCPYCREELATVASDGVHE